MSPLAQLQTNNRTFLRRHWHEFTVLSRLFTSHAGLNVLSFGCSTGEELLSLRALLPGASLFGCDVDWHSLQKARALLGGSATVFLSDDATLRAHGPYDIIVCNSVLLAPVQVVGGAKRGIDPGLWSETVSLLDSAMNPGGVLQIVNTNIPFRLHPKASGYEPAASPILFGCNFVDLFDLESRHLCTGVAGAGWSSVPPRHLGEEHWARLSVDDIETVHWRKSGGRPQPPPIDERLLNLPVTGEWASGTTSYRPFLDRGESRPSTHVEIDTAWKAVAVDSVRLERIQRRIWFDGSTAYTRAVSVDLEGPSATAFIESALGRRSTRLASDACFDPEAVRSPSF